MISFRLKFHSSRDFSFFFKKKFGRVKHDLFLIFTWEQMQSLLFQCLRVRSLPEECTLVSKQYTWWCFFRAHPKRRTKEANSKCPQGQEKKGKWMHSRHNWTKGNGLSPKRGQLFSFLYERQDFFEKLIMMGKKEAARKEGDQIGDGLVW